MLEPGELLSTMDAKVWADEFMETKARLGEKEFDHAMMLGWFANAIMAGFDEATRRQQATIADLQGQLKAAKAPRMYDCGSCAIGKGFEQRVAQLEGEKQEYMQAATNEPLNEPLTYGALKAARFVAKRAFQELVKARADHAALLGLVQALGVVGLPAEHTRPDDFILLKTGEGWMAHTYNYWAKFATEEEARAYIALLEYRASLPAQPAQGGASKPVTTCNRHSDCDAADEKARAKGALHADHCHDDCCSECFGN